MQSRCSAPELQPPDTTPQNQELEKSSTSLKYASDTMVLKALPSPQTLLVVLGKGLPTLGWKIPGDMVVE